MPQVTQLALLILLLPEPRKRQRLCGLLEASRLRHQGLCGGQRPALPGWRNGNGRLLRGLHGGRHGGHEVIGPLGLQGQMLEGWVLRLKHGETQDPDDFFELELNIFLKNVTVGWYVFLLSVLYVLWSTNSYWWIQSSEHLASVQWAANICCNMRESCFLQIHLFTTDCEYLVHLYVKLCVCEVKSGIVQTQLR